MVRFGHDTTVLLATSKQAHGGPGQTSVCPLRPFEEIAVGNTWNKFKIVLHIYMAHIVDSEYVRGLLDDFLSHKPFSKQARSAL